MEAVACVIYGADGALSSMSSAVRSVHPLRDNASAVLTMGAVG